MKRSSRFRSVRQRRYLRSSPNTNNKNNNNNGNGGDDNAMKKCKKCGKIHSADRKWYETCKRCHKGGDDACFQLHPELLEQYRRRTGGSTGGSTPAPASHYPWPCRKSGSTDVQVWTYQSYGDGSEASRGGGYLSSGGGPLSSGGGQYSLHSLRPWPDP